MGDIRNQDALVDFAIETFPDSPLIEQVPIMPTLLEEIRDLFNYSVRHKGGIVEAMWMKDENGDVSYLALFGVYILPLLIVLGLYKIMQMPFNTSEDTVERTQALEESNAYERQKIAAWIQKNPLLRRKHRKWE